MKRKLLAALLAVLLTLSLAACNNGDKGTNIPSSQSGSDDFQKNLHQTDEMYFLETDTGYYVGYGYLYYIDKETMKMTIVCGKPECDHTDTDTCNAYILPYPLLTVSDKIYYGDLTYANGQSVKTVQSVKLDATDRETVQELKYDETSSSQSSLDLAIYHRGYIYYVSDDIVYRVKLGGEKDSAEEIWKPENAGTTQSHGGLVDYNPNAIRYTLWAEGDILYFMAKVQTTDGTYKYVLFQCDLSDMSVKQVWATPDKDEVGEWERTGVSVSQWYVTNGYIYFYLSGGDMWCGDLSTGKNEKLADTHEQTLYGSAVFSDEYMCLLNDLPKDSTTAAEINPNALRHYGGDTIFLYALDGTLIKEISLESLVDELGDSLQINMLFCDATNVYFMVDVVTYSTQYGFSVGDTAAVILYRANFETGEVTQVYKLR